LHGRDIFTCQVRVCRMSESECAVCEFISVICEIAFDVLPS
jgi:hypothetical protein